MKITSIESIRTHPYIRRQELENQFSISKATTSTILSEIQDEIKKGRYDERAYTKTGGFVWVSYFVWLDYLHYREKLKQKNARKYVPDYDPKKWARECAWDDKVQEGGD